MDDWLRDFRFGSHLRCTVSMFVGFLSFLTMVSCTTLGGEPQELERQFAGVVLPFLKTHCFDCHGTDKQEGQLNLSRDSTVASVVQNFQVWGLVVERLTADEMPPRTSPKQPSPEMRKAVVDWIQRVRDDESERHAGDPGIVLARRLSHSEFDNTIRDLTGVDIRPTREFPVDPANESGFDNSGESLTMSPALVEKYLTAARLVADHVVLTPKGFVFAPLPAVTETDRDKFCVQQIVSFYQRHRVDYADYFMAAWQFQHREELGRPTAELRDFANDPVGGKSSLSTKYLATVWSVLTDLETVGPLAELQVEWKALADFKVLTEPATSDVAVVPGPARSGKPQWFDEVRRECERLRDLVLNRRKELDKKIDKLHIKGSSDGSQPLVLWWNRQIAAQRMKCSGDGVDSALDAARSRFCSVFPNAFAVSSRGHYADPNLGVQVRLLTAGFHLMQGYFRDDEPLRELVLDESEVSEIDDLWKNLNFVTLAPIRQYKDFLFFERAEPPRFAGGSEFDFARPENKDVTTEPKLIQMRNAYLAKVRQSNASEAAIEAVETYFANMLADVRWIEQTQLEAQPSHIESLVNFAERAYRRPLSTAERDELKSFYHCLRDEGGLAHDDAIRDSLVSVLMSPFFCFRFDLAPQGNTDGASVLQKNQRANDDANLNPPPDASKSTVPDTKLPTRERPDDSEPVVRRAQTGGAGPINNYELASRLSYFLWSSMPDAALLAHAERGDLHPPDVLMAEVRRMLRDKKARGLATEFAGHWLEFRRFDEHNSVDRERFSSFTNELRQAMYEEPIQFFLDVAGKNGSVLDFVEADHTFVNSILASHYGIDVDFGTEADDRPTSERWVRVDHVGQYGRGGLLTMSVFLTKNSPGLRTSPVKRGYWVVRRLLGERIPPPPPSVPELPKDEASLGEMTLPQLLARHRDHEACAGCHRRFDSIGLTFEGYGPIGERRDKDLGGRPVDTKAVFPDDTEGTGIEGLRRYLIEHRRDEFLDNLCRKLLSYALGRGLILSDKRTLNQMRAKLVADEFRFESLIESIVTSSQFLNKRGMD